MNINTKYYDIYNTYNTILQKNASLSQSLSKLNELFSAKTGVSAVNNPLNSGALKYVSDLKSSSKSLKQSIDALSSSYTFMKKNMVSGNTEALSVNSPGFNIPSMKKDDVTVNIDRLAQGQQNQGAELNANDESKLSGLNKFSVEAGGRTVNLSITVNKGDTNKDVQEKMANAINNSGLDIKASVELNEDKGTSALNIQANGVGNDSKNQFTIKDTSGEAVKYTGAYNITQDAQDAQYRINGGTAKTSKSNTVTLSDGLSFTMKKASEESVKISYDTDPEFSESRIRAMVDSYNSLYSAAVSNSQDPKAQKLFSKMVNISGMYTPSLAAIGIGFDEDGFMTINSDTMANAAKDGKLDEFFTQNRNKSFGFTGQLSKLADSVITNTSQYVSRDYMSKSLTESFAYSNSAELVKYNYLSSGWIFDYSF